MSGSFGVAAVRAAWSSGLNIDSTDPVSIQEAIDQLDQFQNQVRVQLFYLLQRLATQPGEGLDDALGQIAANAEKVIAESPEASILPHIATYRDIVQRIQQLGSEISRKHAEEDVQRQVAEFEERLRAGSLADAAYCCVRLAKMAEDAEEELAAQEARQQQQQEQQGRQLKSSNDSGGGEAGGGQGGAEAATAGGAVAPRVTAEAVALLQETAERCGARLRELVDACCAEAVSLQVGPQGGTLLVRSLLRVAGGSGGSGSNSSSGGGPSQGGGPSGDGGVRVSELFSALQLLGLQEQYWGRMTARLVGGALEAMLAAPCRVTVTPAPQPGAPATLTWKPVQPPATTTTAAATAAAAAGGSGGGSSSSGGGAPCDPEHCCQHLLRLLATWLMEFDEGLMEVLGAPLWRAAADCYIARVARPFISANPEDVEGCEALVAAATDLEAMAENLNFASGEEPYLAPAVEALARHALSSRQELYLQRARG
ncbi:hypothetical protein Agub_g2198, partial [Astrephomene gubernaculifera]